MSITKKIIMWTEDKFENLDPNDKYLYLKAAGLGAIEGAIEGAVLAYPVLVGGCLYWRKKAQKK